MKFVRLRSMGLGLLWVLILIAVLEIGSRAAAGFFPGVFGLSVTPFHRIERLHPFFGYQLTGRFEAAGELSWEDTGGAKISEKPGEGEFRVLLLGGSTAWGDGVAENSLRLPRRLQYHLSRMLREGPLPGIDRITVINGASPGYQTRQNAAVLWSFLKYEPDLVVTLDGYNDLGRTVENRIFGQPPDFPGATWYVLARLHSPRLRLGLWLQEDAPGWWLYRHSVFSRLWINLAISRLIGSGATRETLEMTLSAAKRVTFPRYREWYLKGAAGYEDNLEAMADLARARDIRFLTVLQPYLGYPGPPTPQQVGYWREVGGFEPDQISIEQWIPVYDLLRQSGERLRSRGINWINGSGIFGAEDVSVMVDMMHFNAEGQDRLARFMAERIMEDMRIQRGENR